MGIVWISLAVTAGLVLSALLTHLLESRLFSPAAGHGPAAPLQAREDVFPQNADRWMYFAAPVTALLGVAMALAVIPLGPKLIAADLGIGVFYFIVVVDYVVLGLSLGGWGVNVKNAIEVYYRIVAQLVAYVVPLGLAYIGAIMMAKSLSTIAIVNAQSGMWYIVVQPVGFALYLITGLMQSYRLPFAEAFSAEIRHGIFPFYGGWKALLWRLSLSGVLFAVAAMGAVLYLGGWRGPLLPGPLWMLLKTFGLMALMIWLGARIKPLTTAGMLALSWKILTPVGLLNVLIVGALILMGVGVK